MKLETFWIILLVLFVLLPLLRQRPREPLHTLWRWCTEFRLPAGRLLAPLTEAFLCSYPKGEYGVAGRGTYRLVFLRGAWAVGADRSLSPRVPGRMSPEKYPTQLRVLFQPGRAEVRVTLHYELFAPEALSGRAARAMLAQLEAEARGLERYLAENAAAA